MYIHIHASIYLHVHDTYTSILQLHYHTSQTLSWAGLIQLGHPSTLHWPAVCTCTMYIHCMYMFIQCIYMYIHCTWAPSIISIYPYGVCHYCLVCTAFVIGMYYAILQEFVILCIEVSDRDITPRNG